MSSFPLPPATRTTDGGQRRLGAEFEFSGIPLENAVEAVRQVLGGAPERISRFQWAVRGTRYGNVGVELDAALLKNRRYAAALRGIGVDLDSLIDPNSLDELVGLLAQEIVPTEVITPPVPFGELSAIEELRAALHAAHAQGTGAGLLHAFGLHLNVEAADLSAAGLAPLLKAYVLAEDWLRNREEVDLTRRLSPYVDPFPREYARLLAAPDHKVGSVDRLAADYLAHNPTRNRSLDLLPLLAHVAPRAVADAPVEHHLIKPRPAFHYRMPDCRIDDPGWRVADAFAGWVAVERLAASPRRLAELAAAFLDRPDFPPDMVRGIFEPTWAEQSAEFLE